MWCNCLQWQLPFLKRSFSFYSKLHHIREVKCLSKVTFPRSSWIETYIIRLNLLNNTTVLLYLLMPSSLQQYTIFFHSFIIAQEDDSTYKGRMGRFTAVVARFYYVNDDRLLFSLEILYANWWSHATHNCIINCCCFFFPWKLVIFKTIWDNH